MASMSSEAMPTKNQISDLGLPSEEPVPFYLQHRPLLMKSSDVVLLCKNDVSLPAHSQFLANISEVLAEALEILKGEGNIVLESPFNEYSGESVGAFLDWVYKASFWAFSPCLSDSHVREAILLAHALRIDPKVIHAWEAMILHRYVSKLCLKESMDWLIVAERLKLLRIWPAILSKVFRAINLQGPADPMNPRNTEDIWMAIQSRYQHMPQSMLILFHLYWMMSSSSFSLDRLEVLIVTRLKNLGYIKEGESLSREESRKRQRQL